MVGILGAVFVFVTLCSSGFSSADQITPFNKGFETLYGEDNIVSYEDEGSVEIAMTETTSSGFTSKLMYVSGHFETALKLPESYTAGVVVTFYTSNNQKYPYSHDEIDLEFLGHTDGNPWSLQTNFYGNGHVNRGREERYELWFDPSEDFHRYKISWGPNTITYYIDDVPIRHVRKVAGVEDDFPSKEMKLYATIWNGSDWATGGGNDKLDMSYGPYIAKYSNFVINACPFNQTEVEGCRDQMPLTKAERVKMNDFRSTRMTYSYCYDKSRYADSLPECVFNSRELRHLQKLDPNTFHH